MIRFCWHGIRIELEFSFFAVAACVGLLCGTSIFLQLVIACFLHEIGHVLAMFFFHRRLRSITFCGAGICMCPNAVFSAYWQDVLILLAGPLANLTAAGILWQTSDMPFSMQLHLGLGLFNLFPYRCLDGGSIAEALLLSRNFSVIWTERILDTLSLLFSALALTGMFFCGVTRFSLYGMIGYLTILQFYQKNKS